eukprot:4246917-Heterocapsa_arctica.AAC.1
MWPAEPDAGRFGLPEGFGPYLAQDLPELEPQYMIFDERVCHMPARIVNRIVKGVSSSARNDAISASKFLSKLLRHGDRRVKPFNEG